MIDEQSYGAHSAEVKVRLLLNGTPIRITHMGPDFVLVDCPTEHQPCKAFISLQVDNSLSEWEVSLPQGISKTSKRVALALCHSQEADGSLNKTILVK
jgi:hypothetical protein